MSNGGKMERGRSWKPGAPPNAEAARGQPKSGCRRRGRDGPRLSVDDAVDHVSGLVQSVAKLLGYRPQLHPLPKPSLKLNIRVVGARTDGLGPVEEGRLSGPNFEGSSGATAGHNKAPQDPNLGMTPVVVHHPLGSPSLGPTMATDNPDWGRGSHGPGPRGDRHRPGGDDTSSPR